MEDSSPIWVTACSRDSFKSILFFGIAWRISVKTISYNQYLSSRHVIPGLITRASRSKKISKYHMWLKQKIEEKKLFSTTNFSFTDTAQPMRKKDRKDINFLQVRSPVNFFFNHSSFIKKISYRWKTNYPLCLRYTLPTKKSRGHFRWNYWLFWFRLQHSWYQNCRSSTKTFEQKIQQNFVQFQSFQVRVFGNQTATFTYSIINCN